MKKTAIVIALSLILQVVSITPVKAKNPSFFDVPLSHNNYKAIEYLRDNGILNGYPDGTFKPDQAVARIELLKIALNGAKESIYFDEIYNFPDVNSKEWYAPYVSTAYRKGFVGGNNGNFLPTNTVTRAEALKILFNINHISIPGSISYQPYPDVPLNQWYAPFIQVSKDRNYLGTVDREFFKPGQGMTRADVAEVMYRVLMLEKSGDLYFEEGKDYENIDNDDSSESTTEEENTQPTSANADLIISKVQTIGPDQIKITVKNIGKAEFKTINDLSFDVFVDNTGLFWTTEEEHKPIRINPDEIFITWISLDYINQSYPFIKKEGITNAIFTVNAANSDGKRSGDEINYDNNSLKVAVKTPFESSTQDQGLPDLTIQNFDFLSTRKTPLKIEFDIVNLGGYTNKEFSFSVSNNLLGMTILGYRLKFAPGQKIIHIESDISSNTYMDPTYPKGYISGFNELTISVDQNDVNGIIDESNESNNSIERTIEVL